MSVLIINANTASPVTVQVSRAGRGAPVMIGSKSMSFAGAERSSVRGVRRQFQVVTIPVTDAVRASIEDITSRGAQLPCSGDLFGNIQTQASIEVLSCEGVMGLSDWVMTLGISEIQPSTILLRYAPGDTITGESFSRSTTAYQINAAGVLVSKAINVKRDGHYVGAVGPGILLEDARKNACLQSEDFGTTWAAVATPTRTPAADTGSGVTLDLIGDDNAGAAEGYSQVIAFTGNAVKAVSLFVKQGSSTSSVVHLPDSSVPATRLLCAITWSGGLPVVTMSTGTLEGYDTLAGGVFRIRLVTTAVTAANTNTLFVYPANTTAGDATRTGQIYAGGVQCED